MQVNVKQLECLFLHSGAIKQKLAEQVIKLMPQISGITRQ
jgi:hypothetical protein